MTEPIKQPEALPLADAPERPTAIIVEQCKCGLLAVGYVAELRAEIEKLQADHAEDQSVIAVWRGRTQRAEGECNALRVSSDARIFAETYTRLDAQAAKLIAEIERLREDAERYQWLRARYRAMSMDMGGNHSWVPDGRVMRELRGPTLNAAIDAALKETK